MSVLQRKHAFRPRLKIIESLLLSIIILFTRRFLSLAHNVVLSFMYQLGIGSRGRNPYVRISIDSSVRSARSSVRKIIVRKTKKYNTKRIFVHKSEQNSISFSADKTQILLQHYVLITENRFFNVFYSSIFDLYVFPFLRADRLLCTYEYKYPRFVFYTTVRTYCPDLPMT